MLASAGTMTTVCIVAGLAIATATIIDGKKNRCMSNDAAIATGALALIGAGGGALAGSMTGAMAVAKWGTQLPQWQGSMISGVYGFPSIGVGAASAGFTSSCK